MTLSALDARRLGRARHLLTALPAGRPLGEAAFSQRHRALLVLLWLHVPLLLAFALLRGFTLLHSLVEVALLAGFALVAQYAGGQRLRSIATGLGLVAASSILVHLWGGAIEGHFHFFVVMTALALYQAWPPFLAALGFVVLQHGVLGALAASSVYDHADATAHPWLWALIHGGFLAASCLGNLLAWRLTEEEALHDSLTGLANRALLLDTLEARLRRPSHDSALVYLDLDGFKEVNDGFGHDVGDVVLVRIAQRLRALVGPGDLLARLGGDEFAVLLHRDDGTRARGLLAAFAAPVVVDGLSLPFTASAGVARPRDGSTALSLLRDADLAMYAAKRSGGARCVMFDATMRDEAVHRSALIAELPAGLQAGQFVVHYQRVFRLTDDATVGVEALVRWEHPLRGQIGPGEFIDAAEQSAFIVALGEHVLRTACAQAVVWRRQLPQHGDLLMSVNLSPRQLTEPGLVQVVAAALADSGLEPAALCLEVTENAVIRDLEETLPVLRALSALGVQLALDDFGTGYSSLAYLQRMPVNVLKVDRSFVARVESGATGTAIVRAVVALAHELGLSVTAEGIETERQLAVLRELSCESGQGFLRARPAPAEEVTPVLARERRDLQLPAPRGALLGSAAVPQG